jgi:hypothetical protein
MSWSPRPLRSSLGGRFLGRSGAAGLFLHQILIMPIRCVTRRMRVWRQRRSGDLHPIGCKAESCGVAGAMFVLSAVGMPMPRRRARKAQPRGTASSDLVNHEINGISMRRLFARLAYQLSLGSLPEKERCTDNSVSL